MIFVILAEIERFAALRHDRSFGPVTVLSIDHSVCCRHVNSPNNKHNEEIADLGLKTFLKMLLVDNFIRKALSACGSLHNTQVVCFVVVLMVLGNTRHQASSSLLTKILLGLLLSTGQPERGPIVEVAIKNRQCTRFHLIDNSNSSFSGFWEYT